MILSGSRHPRCRVEETIIAQSRKNGCVFLNVSSVATHTPVFDSAGGKMVNSENPVRFLAGCVVFAPLVNPALFDMLRLRWIYRETVKVAVYQSVRSFRTTSGLVSEGSLSLKSSSKDKHFLKSLVRRCFCSMDCVSWDSNERNDHTVLAKHTNHVQINSNST
jgi:hypothetical protein